MMSLSQKESSIGTHKEAIHVANDLLLYILAQNGDEETAETMGKVVMSLQRCNRCT